MRKLFGLGAIVLLISPLSYGSERGDQEYVVGPSPRRYKAAHAHPPARAQAGVEPARYSHKDVTVMGLPPAGNCPLPEPVSDDRCPGNSTPGFAVGIGCPINGVDCGIHQAIFICLGEEWVPVAIQCCAPAAEFGGSCKASGRINNSKPGIKRRSPRPRS